MAKGLPVYECHNPACSLGTVGAPGHFTSGCTAEAASAIKALPAEQLVEGEDYGEGFCPNCTKPGTATGDEHVSVVGDDPYKHLHDEVGGDKVEGAQAALVALVEKEEGVE